MSLRCYWGYCHRSEDRLVVGIPSAIRDFENWVLSTKFNLTFQGILQHERYHAYLTMTRIAQNTNLAAVWQEYLHFPAPTATGRRSQPARTGDTSVAFFLNWSNFLPGGWVEHTIRPNIPALANVTSRAHFLYPGYILRWLEQKDDGYIISYTLGRGIGIMPETNENKGAEMFMDLDRRIIASLRSRQ